ncbi:expressed unknown protein [Seminavis robusta]|uniref:Uncharacterized protein n=1 Tax=Seminavis robusta TaxID=568900 RepID=A0A9N8EAD6_9STRA|nr:expressed unknown protein [Seminavis robusta]|eukprot:Sro722_g192940.1 n/a (658) ;mRNA; f:39751-41724
MANYQWASHEQEAKATACDALALALAKYRNVKKLSETPSTSGSSPTRSSIALESDGVEDKEIIQSLSMGGIRFRATTSSEPALMRSQPRRRPRRRTRGPKVPTIKGILKKTSSYHSMRFMSEPPPKTLIPQKCVSFVGLKQQCTDDDRWESEGSDRWESERTKTNLEASEHGYDAPSHQGNYYWGNQASINAPKPLSTTSLTRLRKELNLKNALGISHAEVKLSHNSTNMDAPGRSKRDGINPFQDSIKELQSVLVQSAHQQLSKPLHCTNTAPSKPRRQGTIESIEEEEDIVSSPTAIVCGKLQLSTVNDFDIVVNHSNAAPLKPQRQGTIEHIERVSPPNADFHQKSQLSAVQDLQVGKHSNAAPLMPQRQGTIETIEEEISSPTVLQKPQLSAMHDLYFVKHSNAAPSMPQRQGTIETIEEEISPPTVAQKPQLSAMHDLYFVKHSNAAPSMPERQGTIETIEEEISSPTVAQKPQLSAVHDLGVVSHSNTQRQGTIETIDEDISFPTVIVGQKLQLPTVNDFVEAVDHSQIAPLMPQRQGTIETIDEDISSPTVIVGQKLQRSTVNDIEVVDLSKTAPLMPQRQGTIDSVESTSSPSAVMCQNPQQSKVMNDREGMDHSTSPPLMPQRQGTIEIHVPWEKNACSRGVAACLEL